MNLDYRLTRMTKITSTETWSDVFFDLFCALRNEIYRSHSDFLPESETELKALFGPGAPFGRHHAWKAWLFCNSAGRATGRILASARRPARIFPAK